MGKGDETPGFPGLPEPQEPEPLEALIGDGVQQGVREIVESGGPPDFTGAFPEGYPGIELVE
jgi:hypothetical protein